MYLPAVSPDERGFTLVEVLITILLLAVVLGATLALLDNTNTVAARDSERSIAVAEVQSGLNRMVNEIRNAEQVNAANANQIDFNIRCRNTDATCTAQTSNVAEKRIVYRCDAAFSGTSNLPTAATVYRGCVRTTSVTLNAGVCCTAPVPGVVSTPPATAPDNQTCGQTGLNAATCTVVVSRVLNWDTATYSQTPIFTYRLNNNTSTSATLTANQLNPRIEGSIEGFDVQLRVPQGGERRQGIRGDILLKDGGYMRNLDLF